MNHLRAMRPHQWIKNLFVFAALVFSRSLGDPHLAIRSLLVFAAFCAVASSIYLVNDIFDFERDRQHPKKSKRPIASGKVRRRTAAIMAAGLMPIGLTLAFGLSTATGTVLTAYLLLNLTYSAVLKHIVLLDVFVIAFGFLLRVTSGAFAIHVGISPWLLICTFFVALFLAFCKRRHELASLGANAAAHRGILAEYSLPFIDKMVSSLAAMTVMSYALYTIDPKVVRRLGTDALVLTVPFVLFGIFRYLYLVHQKARGGSPTEVALTDRGLQATIVFWLAAAIGVIYSNLQLGLTS